MLDPSRKNGTAVLIESRGAGMVERMKRHVVQWGETDAAAILFYPNYFRWFDQATHDLFRELGYPVARMLTTGHAIPIVECNGRFLASLRYDDEIRITSRIAEVRTRAFRVEHRIDRAMEAVCEGYEVRIWAQLTAGGLQAETIPADLRRVLNGQAGNRGGIET